MKHTVYIRTKDYIHDSKDVVVVNENGTLVVVRGIDKDFIERNRGRIWNTGTNVVLAQADTIEELIDEKILIEEDGYPTLLEVVEFDRNFFLRINEYEFGTPLPSNPMIYGAIWIIDSDGVPTLKPVAKMKGILPNGKIDWELL